MGLYEVIGMRLLVHGWWFCVQLTDVLYFIGFMSVQNQTNMKLKELKWFLVWRLLSWTQTTGFLCSCPVLTPRQLSLWKCKKTFSANPPPPLPVPFCSLQWQRTLPTSLRSSAEKGYNRNWMKSAKSCKRKLIRGVCLLDRHVRILLCINNHLC